MMTYLCIGLGGALGSIARHWLSGVIAERGGQLFPVGTLVVNVTGSFVIGFFATMTGPGGRVLVQPLTRNFVMLGVLGGYTTFSSFSLQTLSLAREGEWAYAGLNVTLSIVLCLGGVWLGYLCAQVLNKSLS